MIYDKITQLRDRHFYVACRRRMLDPDNRFRPIADIIEEASGASAPQFYVSYDHALHTIRRMIYGNPVEQLKKRQSSRRLWVHLLRRVNHYRYSLHLSIADALTQALTERAPSFFISTKTAISAFYRGRKQFSNLS